MVAPVVNVGRFAVEMVVENHEKVNKLKKSAIFFDFIASGAVITYEVALYEVFKNFA